MPWPPILSARTRRRIRRRIRALPRRSVVPAEDEADLMMSPPLRAGWSPRGEPAEVTLSGWDARRVVFGAMSLLTGTRLLPPRPKGRGDDLRASLDEIRRHHRGWHVALLLDEAPGHIAKASRQVAEGMTLLWLPNRAPELNPMDRLWGQAKDVVSADRRSDSIEEQVDRFLDFIAGLSGREALHAAGVLSDDFWLRTTLSKKFCLSA